MIIINKDDINQIALNINNNSRIAYSGYTMVFTHIMSKEEKTVTIDTSNTSVYGENDRYCVIILDTVVETFNYEGEYELKIYGDGTDLVYIGIAKVEGTTEDNSFVEYQSDNEANDNYIFID